ncbi:MAG: hypothetical protein J7J70_10855, partial [Deltaproteobacteria bacterium]|nr:hypothetical protein [Candidatus Tharpellaceae bacterium]
HNSTFRLTLEDVRAWLIAVLAAERITVMVIRGGHLGAGHGRPARMSEGHAGTSCYNFFQLSLEPIVIEFNRIDS